MCRDCQANKRFSAVNRVICIVRLAGKRFSAQLFRSFVKFVRQVSGFLQLLWLCVEIVRQISGFLQLIGLFV